MIFKLFIKFVIVFTFVQLLTSATPCGFREHRSDEVDGNKEDKKVKRQLEVNQLQEVAKEATLDPTKEATIDSTEEATIDSTKEATIDSTKEAEIPENNVIANEEQSNYPLESSEGQGAGNGELAQDPVPEIQIPEIQIPEIQIPEIPDTETPTPEEQPKNETDDSDHVRPIPINHTLSPNTTILGKIKNMFSKVKTWLVGS